MMPKTQKIQSLAMFDNKTILTSIYVMTKKPITKINDSVNELFSNLECMSGGSSILPHDSGVSIRILGNSSEDQKIVIHEILKIVRKEILPDYL
jgi:urease accessory protein UreH